VRKIPYVIEGFDMRRTDAQDVTQPPATRGRPFIKNNPGRKPGSRNRATVFAAALLEGEAEELVRKAIALAKTGDVPMLKFFLSRMLPRERVIKIDLPHLEFVGDAAKALGHILRSVSEAQISPSEAAELATLVNSFRNTITLDDVVKRLDSLDARLNGSGRA
jgi:hypothetical protein